MNWLDFTILAGVGFVALVGFGMGGVYIGLVGAGILGGIALASRLQDRVRPLFSGFTENDNAAEFAAFIAIFILVLVASVVVGFIARSILSRLMLAWKDKLLVWRDKLLVWKDKLLGLGLGILVSFAIGSAVLSAAQSYSIFGLDDTIKESSLGTFLVDKFDVVLKTLRFVPKDFGT